MVGVASRVLHVHVHVYAVLTPGHLFLISNVDTGVKTSYSAKTDSDFQWDTSQNINIIHSP